jgi:hypothetical protein
MPFPISLKRSFRLKEREFAAIASSSTSVQPPSSSRLPAAAPNNRLLLRSEKSVCGTISRYRDVKEVSI